MDSVLIEAIDLRAYMRRKRAIATVESMTLSTPDGPVYLDVSGIANGQAVLDAVCNYAEIADPGRAAG